MDTRTTVYGLSALTGIEAAKLAQALVDIDARPLERVLLAVDKGERGLLVPVYSLGALEEAVQRLVKLQSVTPDQAQVARRVIARCNGVTDHGRS